MILLKKPPMGWNSYDYYDTTVNEEQIRANADYMAEHLREFGWEYIVIDIAWYSYDAGKEREKFQYVPFGKVEMDEYGRLLPCVDRFPSSAGGKGFLPLAEYVHSKGLKFGIHIMRGIPRRAAYERTKIYGSDRYAHEIANPYSICNWNPDMYGVYPEEEGAQEYYDSLAELYAGWGVDFIKCDDICRMDAASARKETEMLHRAIEKTGRDIVLSLSPGPALVKEAEFYHKNANMWRITDDLWDNWKSLRDMFDRCRNWQDHVGDGGYPDCDMLPLGWIGKGFLEERITRLTREEQRTMMTLWCIFRSPLMLGAELTKLDEETLSLLTNKKVLHLLELPQRAREIKRGDAVIVWKTEDKEKNLTYLAVFNVSDEKISLCPADYMTGKEKEAEELWSRGRIEPAESLELKSHDCLLLQLICHEE
ncbi:MAG: glycoside hydrolase family 27 protein [Lachnospiraceae bacterium]|nr:glycoside hydrolase family 27 protein [Lachnospiraceae bacterium]